MKFLILTSLLYSLSASAQYYGGSSPGQGQGSGSAPQHGADKNQGSHVTPHAGLGKSAPATTGRGTDIDGAGTLGQDAYPNSGMTRNRSSDVTGNDSASATMDSANQDMKVPDRNPAAKKTGTQSAEEAWAKGTTQTGPYRLDGNSNVQAEEAKLPETRNDDSASEQERKQQGE